MKLQSKLKSFEYFWLLLEFCMILSCQFAVCTQTSGFLTTVSTSQLNLGSCTDSRSVIFPAAANVYVDGNQMQHSSDVAVVFVNSTHLPFPSSLFVKPSYIFHSSNFNNFKVAFWIV